MASGSRGRTMAGAICPADPEEHVAWKVKPIEDKRPRPKKNDADHVQLYAQASCMEALYDASIPEGVLFCGKTQRRMEVLTMGNGCNIRSPK